VLVALVALLVVTQSAAADCGKGILDDWTDNNVVDRSYPTGCYRLAFPQIPEDAEQYSSIVADIQRAERRDRTREQAGEPADVPPPTPEQFEERGLSPDPPAPAAPAAPDPAPAGSSDPAATPTVTGAEAAPGTGPTSGGAGGGGAAAGGTTDEGTDGRAAAGTGIFGELIGAGGTDTADEVPTAVKVLGGAAGLLLAVGGAGLVAQRRSQGRS